MAAVAGSVAEEVLEAMLAAAALSRAFVNNGGDIALHLAPGTAYEIGLVDRPDRPSLFSTARIAAADPVRGIATSGWRGRSFSLGIADAVTVLAERASHRRCGGDPHRQCGRPSGPPRRHPRARARTSSRTMTWAQGSSPAAWARSPRMKLPRRSMLV